LSTVTLIVFNYDRCIEQYLYLAFQTYYGMVAERAAGLVKKIHIYHPYGSVGSLPWYGGTQTSPFGHEPGAGELLKLAGGIKTFTEGTDPTSSDITAIRAKVLAADRLLFLGFAFHRLKRQASPARCWATGKNISVNDRDEIAKELVALGWIPRPPLGSTSPAPN
jgi:hypothetical protein